MLTNEKFLSVVKDSFRYYLARGITQSPAELKTLHGEIVKNLSELYGPDFTIESQGYCGDSECCVEGRYYPKKVDITIRHKGKPIAGYAVKFVMRNYSQNSNNYFENMLGETANLRANGIPYFQIFIIFDKVPYYKAGGAFHKWDVITRHNLDKYIKLSRDNPSVFYHTPEKTLIVLLSLKERPGASFVNEKDYAAYYITRITEPDLITYSNQISDVFGDTVILNDYENFAQRTVNIVKGKLK